LKVTINENEYSFISNAIEDTRCRESYFSLVKKVFGLDFKPWYLSGFCRGSFIPYTLFDGDAAVSTVGVVINDFTWRDGTKKYIQISTVATDPDYRNQGLSRWLTETVLNEWKENCDSVYLYANDSVVDFYPKFGFIAVNEYRYQMPVEKTGGVFRKLDLSIREDVDLLIKKHKESNPFSLLAMDDDLEIMMFHCVSYLYDNIYYIEKYDAVVIAEQENRDMFCYDIFSGSYGVISDILGIIASEEICTVTLGFTPVDDTGYTVEKANEEDTTVFLLDGMENLFADHKITFPFLSRA